MEDKNAEVELTRSASALFLIPEDLPLYCSQECKVRYETSIKVRLDNLEKLYSDHAQRFNTLQTPWWKRVWFAIQGWPWYDLNGTKKHRPWDGDK